MSLDLGRRKVAESAQNSTETYEEKKQRLLAMARRKREDVAATAKSRLASMCGALLLYKWMAGWRW